MNSILEEGEIQYHQKFGSFCFHFYRTIKEDNFYFRSINISFFIDYMIRNGVKKTRVLWSKNFYQLIPYLHFLLLISVLSIQ